SEREPSVIEVALPGEEGRSEEDALEYVRDVQHAYALLQADLQSGEGAFIAPTWLKHESELMVADVTQDWADALAGISDAGANAFYNWLERQGRPTNVVDFLAEREKRRGTPPHNPDAEED